MPKDPKELEILFENDEWYLLQTRDQSPSLSFKSAGQSIGESMHSHDGAFSETLYIYEPVLTLQNHQAGEIKILSLGLGLGYNEFMSVAWSLKNDSLDLEIDSFESERFLIDAFVGFLRQDQPDSKEQRALFEAYNSILRNFSEHYSVSPNDIVKTMSDGIQSGKIRFHGAMGLKSLPESKYNGIFFDAFSSNTSPDLWTEEFLNLFFNSCSDQHCVVSTYAATGALKRSLKQQGFNVELRKGFSHKRQSTLALKGDLKVQMSL